MMIILDFSGTTFIDSNINSQYYGTIFLKLIFA